MKSNNKLWVVMSGVAAIALLFGALLSAWMLPPCDATLTSSVEGNASAL